jgi:hypothetical protein
MATIQFIRQNEQFEVCLSKPNNTLEAKDLINNQVGYWIKHTEEGVVKLYILKCILQDSWNRKIEVSYDLEILYPTTLKNIEGGQFRNQKHIVTNPLLVEALAAVKGNEVDDNKRAINGMLDVIFAVAPIFSPIDLSPIIDEQVAIATHNAFLQSLAGGN